MRIKTVSVTYGRKFNLGDYNSAQVEVSVWADLDYMPVTREDGTVTEVQAEDEKEVFKGLWERAKAEIRQQALPMLRPQLKVIAEQLEGVKLQQDELRGVLASVIATGVAEITVVQAERKGKKSEPVDNGKSD